MRFIASVPVTPDADEAREWLQRELNDPVYHRQQSLLDKIMNDILDALNDSLSSVGISPVGGGWILAIVVALGIGYAAWRIAGPAKGARGRKQARSVILEDDPRTAKEMRSAAEAFAKLKQWDGAIMDRFRAIVRSMEERVILDERSGRTAYEAARDAGTPLPSHAAALLTASAVFDGVCYGHSEGDAEAYARIEALDTAIAAATPQLVGAP